jgi:sugar lactone lactonase YvrE
MKMGDHVLQHAIVRRNITGLKFNMRIWFTLVFIILSVVINGQNPVTSPVSDKPADQYIKWIGYLPDREASDSKGFFEKIYNFIVGTEPVVLNNPVNVYATDINDYVIVNQGNGNIVQFNKDEIKVLPAFRKEKTSYPSLVSLCKFSGGRFLFTDSRLNRIFILSNEGNMISSLNDGLTLNRPTGIAFSQAKNEIWVVETGSHQISVLDSNGKLKRIVGKRGDGNLEFNFPTNIWIDSNGKIYIVDSMNFRIQVLSPDGSFLTSFGQQGDATGSFARPRSIATDSKGNIYVVDALFNAVQIFDISGNLLYYFGSQGSGKYQFWMPSGIFIDKNDYVYISDSYNGRIQIFQLVKN